MKGWWNDKCSAANWKKKEREQRRNHSWWRLPWHLGSVWGALMEQSPDVLAFSFYFWGDEIFWALDFNCGIVCTSMWRRFLWNVVTISSSLLFFQKRMWERKTRSYKKKKQPRDGLQDQVIFNPTISETEHWAMNAISDEPVRERLHALTSHSSQTQTKRPNNYRYHWIFYNIKFCLEFFIFFSHTTCLSEMDAL